MTTTWKCQAIETSSNDHGLEMLSNGNVEYNLPSNKIRQMQLLKEVGVN